MEIVIILGLIFFNGILSMSEIAMVSARKSRLETAAKKGSKTAKTACVWPMSRIVFYPRYKSGSP